MIDVSEIAKLAADFMEQIESETIGSLLEVGTVVIVCDLVDPDGATVVAVRCTDKRDWVTAGLLDRAASECAVETTTIDEDDDDD